MRVLSAAKGEVVALGFVPGRAALVAAYERDGVFVWDLASDAPPRRCLPDEYFRPRAVTFTPDGGQFVYPSPAGLVAVDLATGGRARNGPAVEGALYDAALTPDARRLVSLHGAYHAPKLAGWRRAGSGWEADWSADPGEGATAGLALAPAGDRVTHLRRRAGGRWPWRYELVVRDAGTGEPTGVREYTYYSRFHFHPAGGRVVAVHEMTLLVWDLDRAGKPLAVRNDTRRHFTAAAWHPAGRHLFTTSNDATVIVWDAAGWSPARRFTWNVGRLRSAAVSPDGALAAAGSDKGQVVVWDVDL